MLSIDQRVTDEACAADHADEFFFRQSIPLLTRDLCVVDLDFISRLYDFYLSFFIGFLPTAPEPISCEVDPSSKSTVSFRWIHSIARSGVCLNLLVIAIAPFEGQLLQFVSHYYIS